MNKDALLATLIGFGIGLVITGVFLLGPNLKKSFPSLSLPKISISLPAFPFGSAKNSGTGSPTTSPVPTPTVLTIENPVQDMIVSSDTVLISGKAPPSATIVLEGQADELVLKAADDGTYAGELIALEGKNVFTATSYMNEKVMSQSVTVYYTPEKL